MAILAQQLIRSSNSIKHICCYKLAANKDGSVYSSYVWQLVYNGRGYEQLIVACAMERIAYSLCYVGAMACV